MYADRVATGRKRSVKERLYGNLDDDLAGSRSAISKRMCQSGDQWKHALYEEVKKPQTSSIYYVPVFQEPIVGPEDLRLKLQKKASQQGYQGGRKSGVRDLREKLSGTMHAQPPNTDLPKAKVVSGGGKLVEKISAKVPEPETKKTSGPTSSRKNSQQKSDLSLDNFLKSLGLKKYLITFKAEEVDMTVLKHMTDKDLKTLGIPMGPRKKILLTLESGD